MSAEDHIGIGAHMNPRWDGDSVRDRLRGLNIPLDAAVGTLSGGQRAQVALALTLAKRPRVLLLDEPVAALDPLARRHGPVADPEWEAEDVSLEDMVLGYMGVDAAPAIAGLTAVGDKQ